MENQEFMETQELREAVNPVFNTAKSCLQLNAASGDQDSIRLLEALGFPKFGEQTSAKPVPKIIQDQVKKISPAYMILVETRFQAMNRLLDSRPDRQVVDLPCGYTARGIRMANQNRKYIGIDLPAVIETLTPAVKSITGDNRNISYSGADATNYASLAAAIPENSKDLLITTEGLIMYFSQSELDVVFENIHKLLSRYGGSWIITDRAYNQKDVEVATAALGGNPILTAMYSAITGRAAGSTADVAYAKNVYFDPDDSEVIDYIHSKGFELRQICIADYLPEKLGALESSPLNEVSVRKAFKDMFFWELTVKADGEKQEYHSSDKDFKVDADLKNGVLDIVLTGRLDTLTSPALLKIYQDATNKEEIGGIDIDMTNLEYISSAGLRVLLIMYKGLKKRNRFCVYNVSDSVKEIFETTGFTFLLE